MLLIFLYYVLLQFLDPLLQDFFLMLKEVHFLLRSLSVVDLLDKFAAEFLDAFAVFLAETMKKGAYFDVFTLGDRILQCRDIVLVYFFATERTSLLAGQRLL